VGAPPPNVDEDVDEDVTEIVAAAEQHIAAGVPACQVAIARDGDVVWTGTFGAASDTTRFCIFSATKPIVASAIWLLLGEDRLDLDAKVVDHIPEFATNGKDVVTVEQVLLHTAGFPSAPMDPVEGADPVRRRHRFTQWRLQWEPGTQFEYHTSSAHWVLADLIERVTGEDFRDVVEQRVTAPLGLPRLLGLPPDGQDDIAPMVRVGEPGPGPDDPVVASSLRHNEPAVRTAGPPAGGGYATAATLARFYQALLHDPATSAGPMWDPAVLADATVNVRCRLTDPMMNVPCNRTIGLVVAGDDGKHMLRQGMFGRDNSPATFGHAGANTQIAWADPATGYSFVYLNSAADPDMMRAATRGNRISTLASALR
jgi:CubicO group peptidase (beta-lactamase class C family)